MAKRVEQSLSRKQISRREKEARLNQGLIIGTAVVLGLVLILIAWGLIDQFVLRPRTPVVIVADQEVPLSRYQKLVRYRRWDYRNYINYLEGQKMQASTAGEGASFLIQYYDQQIQQLEAQLRTLPTQVVEDLVDEQIVRLAAQERGLSVSDEEVQIRIEEQFGYLRNPPTPEPTPITVTTPISETQMPTPTPMTKEAFIERSNQWFSAMREATGFTREDFEELIRNAILREKLEEQLVANVPTTAEQIHARHILVETREEAEAVKQRLEAGESFEALAAEVSVDTSNKDNGGDLGWFARGRMVPEFEEAAFALEPGEISDVVQTSFGFHIIKVEERDPNRELDAYALEEAKQKAIDDWFAAQRETLKVERNWNSSMVPEDKVQPPTGR